MRRTAVALLAVAIATTVACSRREARPGTVQDEAMRAGLTAEHFVRKTDDYFRDMDDNLVNGKRPVFTQPEIEGRNMWMVWTGGNDRLWDRLTIDSIGSFDLLKTISSHRAFVLRPAQPVVLARAGQRAVLHRSDRSGSESVRAVARRARPEVPARSVRRVRRPILARASAPGEPSCRSAPITASPPAWSACGCFRTPTSTRTRAAHGMPSGSTTTPTYYSDRELVRPYRVGMSCAFCHVGPNPIRPPADPENPEWAASELERRRAVFLVGPRLQLAGRSERRQHLLSGAARVAARHARHLARLDRQHQQPADDERGVLPRSANGAGEAVGEGDDGRRRAAQQAVQRVRAAGRSPRAVLHPAEHDVDAARAEGRLRLGRRARRAQPRLHQHRRVQRGMAPALPRAARRRADLADSARDHPEELGLLARDREADAVHGAVLPREHRSPLSEGRARRRRST